MMVLEAGLGGAPGNLGEGQKCQGDPGKQWHLVSLHQVERAV